MKIKAIGRMLGHYLFILFWGTGFILLFFAGTYQWRKNFEPGNWDIALLTIPMCILLYFGVTTSSIHSIKGFWDDQLNLITSSKTYFINGHKYKLYETENSVFIDKDSSMGTGIMVIAFFKNLIIFPFILILLFFNIVLIMFSDKRAEKYYKLYECDGTLELLKGTKGFKIALFCLIFGLVFSTIMLSLIEFRYQKHFFDNDITLSVDSITKEQDGNEITLYYYLNVKCKTEDLKSLEMNIIFEDKFGNQVSRNLTIYDDLVYPIENMNDARLRGYITGQKGWEMDVYNAINALDINSLTISVSIRAITFNKCSFLYNYDELLERKIYGK